MSASCEITLRDERGNCVSVKITGHANDGTRIVTDEARKTAGELFADLRKEESKP